MPTLTLEQLISKVRDYKSCGHTTVDVTQFELTDVEALEEVRRWVKQLNATALDAVYDAEPSGSRETVRYGAFLHTAQILKHLGLDSKGGE